MPDRDRQGWLPHVTLARRLRPEQVEAARRWSPASACPGVAGVALVLAGLRHWDPDEAVVRDVALPAAR